MDLADLSPMMAWALWGLFVCVLAILFLLGCAVREFWRDHTGYYRRLR